MKTKSNGSVQFSYKMPNVIQIMKLFGKLGLDQGTAGRSNLETLGDTIECLAPYVSDVVIDGQAADWDGLLSCADSVKPLMEFATEVINALAPKDSEKK